MDELPRIAKRASTGGYTEYYYVGGKDVTVILPPPFKKYGRFTNPVIQGSRRYIFELNKNTGPSTIMKSRILLGLVLFTW